MFPFFGYNAAMTIGAYKCLFESLLPILLCIYSEVKSLDQIIPFDYVRNCHILFPMTVPFNLPTAMHKVFNLSTSGPTLNFCPVVFLLFIKAIFIGMNGISLWL